MSRRPRSRPAIALATLGLLGTALAAPSAAAAPTTAGHPSATQSCSLGPKGATKHVVYIQFDNTHLRRDNPNVPSDLEQMPHLLSFMRDNGTLLSNDHTILISHTAGGILSSLTGVYPDRHGQIVSNSNVRFNGTGFQFPSSFGYWTDPVAANTTIPNMVTPTGANAPAPWVPYTRAGCDFGAIGTANTVLENTGTGPSGDITKVFGPGSPQFAEAQASAAAPSGTAARAKAQTDFVGFAIHCAQGSTACTGGQADVLPDEPGGYGGYKGMFGAQEIDPLLTNDPAVTGLDGQPIVDPFGQPGFPGFDGMSAAVSLAYTAEMQEAGVPVTFSYISDAHDFHGVAGNDHQAFGPGSAGYVAQLKAYDDAFAAFFTRLASDGINKSNTLFVFTVDEGDHFAGVEKTDCDGVSTPCVYGPGEIGEINANIDTLLFEQHPELFALDGSGKPVFDFTVHGDDAPTFYLSGNPAPTSSHVRDFERATAELTAANPYTGETAHPLLVAMADREEQQLLHMSTAGDPNRNPTFTLFADADYFLTDFPSSTCETCINAAFAWNHGDIQPEIANTWLGFVGPGIRQLGETGDVWTDHTDVRPTMLVDLGLDTSYENDGRAITEVLTGAAVPHGLNAHRGSLQALGAAYKQLDAPFGRFGMATLAVATAGIRTGSASDDSAYAAMDARLAAWGSARDALADRIADLLDGVEFGGPAPSESTIRSLTKQATDLTAEVEAATP
ncbi:MAG TPA: hypothetical protein VFI28_09100 [Candidatus Limnocylindrales bacterium]|nr:hypothetical protein [Candidatus Limnocylindrales bacterium]